MTNLATAQKLAPSNLQLPVSAYIVEFYYPEEIALFERKFVGAERAAYMETCIEDDEIAERMDQESAALLARGVNEVGPYQSPMEDGSNIFMDGTDAGRHPLPSPEDWAQTKTRLGITPNTLVVAYDKQSSVYARRLWWMLKATGHAKVQVLDGGLDSWNGPMGTVLRLPNPAAKGIEPRPYAGLVLVGEVVGNLQTQKYTVMDARANDPSMRIQCNCLSQSFSNGINWP